MKLEKKRAVITGGTKGLGRALVTRFLSEGADIAICARNSKDLESAKKLAPAGRKIIALQCDISNSTSVNNFAESVLAEFGTVDILVNNASKLGPRVPVAEYPIADWDEVVQTNINGTFFLTRLLIPSMMKRGTGCIINISSSVGKAGRKNWGAYAVSKAGIEGMTQVLADELKSFNIRVNSVNPGPMATEMRRAAYPNEDPSTLRTPDQLTDIFVYLASQDGVGISGQSFDAATFISNPRIIS
ncbi:MAG: SDR family oxidoreductase [Bacteroidota bacterium]